MTTPPSERAEELIAQLQAELAAALEETRNMRIAMDHRAAIEQAKGIIMGAQRCGPDEAFRLLAVRSQNSNRKLHDLAVELVARTAAPRGN